MCCELCRENWLVLEQNGKHYNMGAKAFRKNISIVKLLKNKAFKKQSFKHKTQIVISYLFIAFCIRRFCEDSLCCIGFKAYLIVNVDHNQKTQRPSTVHHRQFKSFLEDVETKYEDIIYHNNVKR